MDPYHPTRLMSQKGERHMAAVDYFLKVKGIDGESQDNKHKGEIQIESFSWGEHQMGTYAEAGGGGAGKVDMGDFVFAMKMNKASPKLMKACACGEAIPEAILTCRKAGKEQQEFFSVKLTDLLVSSYVTSGSGGAVIPIDTVTMNFGKVEMEYKEQKADGTLGGSIKKYYNLKEQKGG